MTAQAGAVAVEVKPFSHAGMDYPCHPETCCCPDYDLFVNGEVFTSGSRDFCVRIGRKVQALSTTPAAVPVEALEGLVAELRNEAGDWTSGDVRAAYNRISDRIERLIKERSNG